MTGKSGTATNDQFVQVLSALAIAAATAIKKFDIVVLLKSLNGNGTKLTECLQLVFTALISGQKILLRSMNASDFSVWKTIELGTVRAAKFFSLLLPDARCWVSPDAAALMLRDECRVSAKVVEVDLVRVTLFDLGLPKGSSFQAICNRVIELGLKLCPAEVGPQLTLQYGPRSNQDQWLIILMDPISVANGDEELFEIGCQNGGELNLYVNSGHSDQSFRSNTVFVCVKPRST